MTSYRHKNRLRLFVTDTFLLPADKPDIDILLRATLLPHLEPCVCWHKTIQLAGWVELCIEYAAGVSDLTQPVVSIAHTLSFEKNLPWNYARTNRRARFSCRVLQQRLQKNSPREITVSIELQLRRPRFFSAGHSLPFQPALASTLHLLESSSGKGL